MKLLIYTPRFYPTYVGGGERLAAISARGMRVAGADVRILTAGPRIDSYEHDGVPVHTLPHAPGDAGAVSWGPTISELDHLLAALCPDAVHLVGIAGGLAVVRHSRRLGARIGMASMEYSAFCRNRTLIRGSGQLCAGRKSLQDCFRCRLEGGRRRDRALGQIGQGLPGPLGARWTGWASRLAGRPFGQQLRWWADTRAEDAYREELMDHVSLFVSPTRFALDLTVPHLGSHVRTAVVPYPGLPSPGPVPPKETPRDRLAIGFVGRAIPLKGLDILLPATDMLAPRVPIDVRVFCPENDDWRDYREVMKIETARRPFARWIESGEFSAEALANLHRSLDVLVVPSRWPEFVGFVTLEALSHGTPVVLSDYAPQRELFGHVSRGVRFVRPGSAADLAATLAELWEAKRRGELGVEGFHALSIEQYGARLLDLYATA